MGEVLVDVTVAGVPESVNHLWRAGRGGHFYKTAKAREFEEILTLIMAREKKGTALDEAKDRVELRLKITKKSKRRYDLDNRIKSVQDCLSKAGIISDDSQVYRLVVEKAAGEEDSTSVTAIKMEEA